MRRFTELVADSLRDVDELFPWDLTERLPDSNPLLLDVREPSEFDAMHIEGSINVPRGILESASEYGYEETEPQLASAREREVIVICRSGNRSALAAHTLKQMGFETVYNLKTGLRGWNDFEQPLVDSQSRQVSLDEADSYFTPRLRPEQEGPSPKGD